MRRHLCCHQDGIVALVTMASLPLIRNGIVALVVLALLPSSSWHHLLYRNGIVVIINAQASLPSLQWSFCPCHDGVVDIDMLASLSLCNGNCWHPCNGISAVVELA
jgi:hypothetical protein